MHQNERQTLVTPLLRNLAALTLWDVFKGLAVPLGGISLVLGSAWWLFWLNHVEQHDLEWTANEDADEALESIADEEPKDRKKKKGKPGKKKDGQQ